MPSKKLDLTKNVQRIAANKAPQASIDTRHPTIDYPISTRAADTVLPAEAGVLSERLQRYDQIHPPTDAPGVGSMPQLGV